MTDPRAPTDWRERRARSLQAALARGAGADVVAEALGAVYADAILFRPPPAEAEGLSKVGRAARASLAAAVLADDAVGDAPFLRAVVEAGLSALEGDDVAALGLDFGEPFAPEDARVAAWVDGRLDGLSAARVAAAVTRDAGRLEHARLLATVLDADADALMAGALEEEGGEPGRWLAAADDARPLLDPAQGRRVGQVETPALEAFVFDGGEKLALYAAEPFALRVEAKGATTLDMQPGYWLGRLEPGLTTLDARVLFGEQTLPLKLTLD